MLKTGAPRRWPRAGLVLAVACLVVVVANLGRPANTEAQFRYTSDQNIQPVYEGWERNPDGSYNMLFGYLNRNWVEEPEVPVGANNSFSPGPVDQGQPTHFYPRRQLYMFKVWVPADWGDKKLVWTVTHAGRTDQAVGKLLPFYENDVGVFMAIRSGNLRPTAEEMSSQPPSLTLNGPAAVTTSVGDPVTLSVTVSDDGLPGPRQSRGGRPVREVLERPSETSGSVMTQDIASAFAASKTGLAVTWLHHRGPGMVTFDPAARPS